MTINFGCYTCSLNHPAQLVSSFFVVCIRRYFLCIRCYCFREQSVHVPLFFLINMLQNWPRSEVGLSQSLFNYRSREISMVDIVTVKLVDAKQLGYFVVQERR